MAKNIVDKRATSIKGILNIDKDSGAMTIEIEDGMTYELSELLEKYDGCEISMSVSETVEIG